jgi:hypothetical protein
VENAVGGLVRAVEAARLAEKPVRIHLAAGTYLLSETLRLDERDNHTTFLGDGAVITGGVCPDEWRDEGDGIVSAAVPADARFTQLFVDGARRERTRYPAEGFFLTKGSSVSGTGWANEVCLGDQGELANRLMYFDPKDMPAELYRAEDVEFIILQYWMEARLYLENLNRANGEALFKTGSWRPLSWSYGFYMENVREGLNIPGRWYHDKAEHRVYYHLQDGESAASLRAAYPGLARLIEVAPSSGAQTASHIRFEGITFTGSDSHPSGTATTVSRLS